MLCLFLVNEELFVELPYISMFGSCPVCYFVCIDSDLLIPVLCKIVMTGYQAL